MNDSHHQLLLDIDALFDTRMGTMLRMCPDLLDRIDVDKYRKRTIDRFDAITDGIIDMNEFTVQYEKRNVDTLRSSIITGIVPVLITHLESIGERYHRGVDVQYVGVDLNTFPYVLPGPVQQSMVECLQILLPAYVNVRLVHFDVSKKMVDSISSRYNGWITYNIHPWLETNKTELIFKPANKLSVIIPKLFIKEPGELRNEGMELDEELEAMDKHGLLEMVMEEFLHMEHIPVEDFCFIVPGQYRLV